MSDIGVLVVHGMGTATADFWRPLARAVDDRLEELGVARGSVAWQPGHWAQHLDASEEELWRRARQGGAMDFASLRRFVLTALGDAVAYRRVDDGGADVYGAIHESIRGHLRTLRATLGADRPLVVIAHSLGSVIMSDFIWNAQHPNEHTIGRAPFECMQTLAGLVTFGSTLPLFSLAVQPIVAIEFPPRELAGPLRAAAKWYNYYDRDDVLGWPLRTLSPS